MITAKRAAWPALESAAPLPAQNEIHLGHEEFTLLRDLVCARTGIELKPAKRELLKVRLRKRLQSLGLGSYRAYHDLLTQRDRSGEEIARLIDSITTTKTEFFRSPEQFEYMARDWLPRRIALAAETGERRLRIWSAGCSSGEEPFTIALVVLEALGASAGSWDVKILGSDINRGVLERAATGVYTAEQASGVPGNLLRRYFLRGIGSKSGLLLIRPEVRRLVTFTRINLLDDWPIASRLDAVFCRNVLIYLDGGVQREVTRRFVTTLNDGGLIFLGHAEHAHGRLNGLRSLGDAIYAAAPSPPG